MIDGFTNSVYVCAVCQHHPAGRRHPAQHHAHGLADPSVLPHDLWRGGVLCHRAGVRLLTGTLTRSPVLFPRGALHSSVFTGHSLPLSPSAQAPKNMKAVLQAGWLLTTAVGNIIVLIVAEAGQLPDQVRTSRRPHDLDHDLLRAVLT